MENRDFFIVQTADARDLPLPRYMTAQAAGMDLHANVHEDWVLASGEYKLVPTGVRLALPEDSEAQVRPRSGLALRHGVTILNSPGTVDADYRGELAVLLINHGREDFVIRRGDRVAQLVISPVFHPVFQQVEELDETGRGAGGYGHTGV